jgi:hypothetical protein
MKLRRFAAIAFAGAVVASVQLAPAATMPSAPNHLWLLDNLGSGFSGKATPDTGSSSDDVNLYATGQSGGMVNPAGAGTKSAQLAGVGDSYAVEPGPPFASYSVPAADLPFQYVGNKAAVNDWGVPAFYPGRVSLAGDVAALSALPNAGMHIGASGAISFWLKPIQHIGTGYGHFFQFADDNGNALYATADPYLADSGSEVPGAVVTALNFGSEVPNGISITTGGGTSSPTFDPNTIDQSNPYFWGPNVTWGGAGTPNSYPGGAWVNMVFSWDPSGMKVYENGVLFTQSTMVVPEFYANYVRFGANITGDYAFPGLFDEVSVWDTALTADNAAWLAANSQSPLWVVPEPTSAGLLAMGLIGLARLRRKR